MKKIYALWKSIQPFFTRDYWLSETNVESDSEEIKDMLETTSLTQAESHKAIGKGLKSFLGNGPYEKIVEPDGRIIIKSSCAEELHITRAQVTYLRKHRRMDGTNKHRIVFNRAPIEFNKKASNISPGYMKQFMMRYMWTLEHFPPGEIAHA